MQLKALGDDLMPALSLNDLVAIALCALALLGLAVNFWMHRRKPYGGLRQIPAITNSETLIQAAAEQGQRLTFAIGLEGALSVKTLAGLPVLRALSRQSIFSDHPLHALSGGGVLASFSQSLVRGTYQGAIAVELFKP